MGRGYMGQLLNVDLSTGKVHREALDEDLCHDYIGGYGLGARLLYDRMPAHADALGPDNILGFLTGPLTGTQALIGSRFVAVGKSPKTHTWGDGNCGGYWGGKLKAAGYDGILFSGISERPSYLLVDDGNATLQDASDLWGTNVTDLEDTLQARHGKDAQVVCIGPSGEKLSLLAAIMNDKERAAGRSGLGAVMGSKRLKAIVVRGSQRVPVFDAAGIKALRTKFLKQKQGSYETFHKYGTAGITADSALSGDSPIRNWGGSAVDFPEQRARRISDDAVVGVKDYRPYACSGCPIGCGGRMRQDEGEYTLEYNDRKGHKPEYETLCMLGSNLLNDDLPSIIKLNEICNAYGLDTISLGGTIGWAIECYENGLLKARDLDGLEMRWGNARAIVDLAQKIALREGVGDLLADGVQVAWKRFDGVGTEFAVHIGGEELPAHDPKFTPGLAMTYALAPTPGRHTQGGELCPPPSGMVLDEVDKYAYSGHANNHWKLVTSMEVCNAAGLCMFGYLSFPFGALPEQLTAVTGWQFDDAEVFRAGERVFTMRHLFNLRDGHNPLTRNVPDRAIGNPPLKEGNVRGVKVDIKNLSAEFLARLDWDGHTTIPSEERLHELGMDFAVADRPAYQVQAV